MRKILFFIPFVCQAAFFDHFTGTSLHSRWTTSTAGEGVVCVNGTLVAGVTGTCPSSVTGETFVAMAQNANAGGTMLIPNFKVDKTKSQLWLWSLRRDTGSSSLGFVWAVNSASTPISDTISGFEANARFRVGFGNTNTVLVMDKWDSSHVKTSWDSGTSTWVTTPTNHFSPQASLNSYYVVGIEIDGPNSRWRAISFTKNGTGFSTPTQGLILNAMTDWVLWSSQETSTDLWLVFGYPYTSTGLSNTTRVEWVYHADGEKQHSWTNGKSSSGNYRIKHNWGYVGPDNTVDVWVPEDRTTVAINLGTGWEAVDVKDPSVIQVGSTYYMTYSGSGAATPFQIGLATASSPDGPWTKDPDNPIIPTAGGNEEHVYFPQLVHDLPEKDSAKRWKIYYTAFPVSGGTPRIYMAYCAGPPESCTWTRSNLIMDIGPAASTISAGPTGVSQSGTTVTITTTAAHGIPAAYIGTPITLSGTSGCSPAVDGSWTLTGVPTTTQVIFTHSQSATQTCGSGTLRAFDTGGWWHAHAYYYHGRWWIFAAPDAGGTATRRIMILYDNGNGAFVPSYNVLVASDQAICNTDITSNVTASRVVNVTSSAGCQADDSVVFDQDTNTSNLVRSRILRVVSGTQVELYHQLDGLTTTTPARMISSLSHGHHDESFVQQDTLTPSTFWMRTVCYSAYHGSATYAGHNEDTCLFKSTTGILGPYSLIRLWSPHAPFHNFTPSFINSNENMTLLRTSTMPVTACVRRGR